MNEQEIQKLAEEFARLKTVSQAGAGEEIRRKTLLLTQFVWFLSDRYCIVEKKKIQALYSKMELDGNHVDSDNDWAVYEAMDELEKIFGSELFNGMEK